MSGGVPSLPSGNPATTEEIIFSTSSEDPLKNSEVIAVRVCPGRIELARMPSGASNLATALAKETMPPFAYEYMGRFGDAMTARDDDVKMIDACGAAFFKSGTANDVA